MTDRRFIRHVVFFSAKDKADVERIREGLMQLAEIPHSRVFEVEKNMRADQFSSEIDVVVYAEFEDEAAFQAFKAHPTYQACTDLVRPMRDIRIAADF